jgi:membrane-associated protease RseP (regulator of RpoE activity)
MSRKESRGVWDTLLIVAVAAMTLTFAHAQQAAAEEDHEDGRIIDLSADGSGGAIQAEADEDAQEPAQPAYWLGLQGAPIESDVLRTHLQLADDVGVIVADVMKDSPAEKAGLRKHDILLEVNGEQITDMTVLQRAVADSAGKPLELRIIRLAKEEPIEVTPEERPADLALSPRGEAGGALQRNRLEGLLRGLPQGDVGGLRIFGNGIVGGGMGLGNFPGGVSVSVTREGDGPATVTVKKGDQTWTVKGDDEEALKELPDDVRPFVEQMLHGQRGAFNFGELQGLIPDATGRVEFDFDGQGVDDANRHMMERMEQLERQLDELRQQLQHQLPAEDGNARTGPANHEQG